MKKVLLLTMAVLSLISCSKEVPIPEEAVRPITWMRVSVSDFEQIRRLSGTIEPVESTDLSFEVGGKIDTITAVLGDQIRKDQVIAQLDKRTYNLSLKSAEANLQQTEASLVEAKNEFIRYQDLVDKGLVSRSGFDNVQAAYESATSAVNIAQAQLDIARKDLSDTDLRAPYDGTVTKRLAEPSMQVAAGKPIFEIEGKDGLEVKVMVPETLITQLDRDRALTISYPVLPGVSHLGTITEIGSRAETANAFPVTVLIEWPSLDLRAGMTAEVDFVFEGIGRSGYRGEIYDLPIAAILPAVNQEAFVFIYDEQTSTVSRRKVVTENIRDNRVQVSSGLKVGEIVATAGVTFLREGQTVSLVDKHIQQYN